MNVKLLLIVVFLIWNFSTFAHDSKGSHGGRITDAGTYHVEMVVKADVVEVFITDTKDKPVASSGFKGTAILVVEGKSQRIVLEPADTARLSGKAASTLPDQPKGVVQLIAPDGKTAQGKFN